MHKSRYLIRKAGYAERGQTAKYGISRRPLSAWLPGILPGLTVIIGLEAALPVISHSVALLRSIFRYLLLQSVAESESFGGAGVRLSGTAPVSFRLRYAGYHLNRIHFEIGLNSVCCVNPSLDAYFKCAITVFLLIISAESLEKITDF